MQEYIYSLVQACLIIVCSPLLLGITKKTKAFMQNRTGPNVLQPYYDLYKWWHKDMTIAKIASWIFIGAPLVYLSTAVVAALLMPVVGSDSSGDVFVVLYLLAAGRFMMTLAALDTATTFGGMGASRELFIATLIEPVMLIGVLNITSMVGSTSLSSMANFSSMQPLNLSTALAMLGFFMLLLAENGRVPVDNPDTHLELTMVHEGMLLEYSGKLLAMINIATYMKQLIFYIVFARLFFVGDFPIWLKIIITAILVGIAETLNNKMRLFRIPYYISIAGILFILSTLTRY